MSHNTFPNELFDQSVTTITHEGNSVVVELIEPAEEGLGLDNPNGVTFLAVNGFAESAETWFPLARKIALEGLARQLPVNVVRYTDDRSYSQEAHSDIADMVARQVREEAAPGHRIYAVGHSRGGLSVADKGDAWVEESVIDGLCTMATPVNGIPLLPWQVWREAKATPASLIEKDARDVQAAFIKGLYKHLGGTEALTDISMRTLLRGVLGIQQEIHDITRADPDRVKKMINLAGKVPVVAMLNGKDRLVSSEANTRHLLGAGFTGSIVQYPGQTHNSPLMNGVAVHDLVNIAHKPAQVVAA